MFGRDSSAAPTRAQYSGTTWSSECSTTKYRPCAAAAAAFTPPEIPRFS